MASNDDALGAHAKELRDDVKELGRDLRKFMETVGAEARDGASHLVDRARNQSGEAYRNVAHAVKERPGVALGVAAGAGLLIGLLLSHRR